MTSAFLDTSYLLALESVRDQFHAQAQGHWATVVQRGSIQLVTTALILNEVVTYLNSRSLHDKAVEVGDHLLQSSSVRLVHVDESLLVAAW